MAKRQLHARALLLRQQGMSYSQIKSEIGVSKGTLSAWLHEHPLSKERIAELRDKSDARIERCRITKARHREERLEGVRGRIAADIGILSVREQFLCGLFLYWGEGSKTQRTSISVANTDPAAIQSFKQWLTLLGVPGRKMRVRLQLYADMNVAREIQHWSGVLGLPAEAFLAPYIKSSNRIGLSYFQRFTHGTCNLTCHDRDIAEYVHLAIEHLRTHSIAGDS